ncbi:MAG: SDR family NAD(P)-dependent oxidoreductase [Candidatus Dormibacterales bacterium]
MLIDSAKLGRPLDGVVALITGVGRGIGRSAALALSRLGASIVIAEVAPSGRDTQTAIREAGGHAVHIPVDVSDPIAMEYLKGQALAWFNKVDIVINNACAFYAKPLLEYTVEEWDEVMAVNLRAAFLAAKLFIPPMLVRGKGTFVTMESGDGMPFMAPYFASKVGLRSLAMSLSQELGAESRVSVFCFGAGMVDTPGLKSALPRLGPLYGLSEGDFVKQSAPGGVLMTAEDCGTGLAGCVLHAESLHGQEVTAPTGLSMLGLSLSTSPVTARRPEEARFEPSAELDDDWSKAAQAVQSPVTDLRGEFDALGMFQRQWYRRTLKQRTGMDVEEWEVASRSISAAPTAARSYAENVRKLAAHFNQMEADARGYIHDEENLRQAIAVLERRRVVAEGVASKLG